MLWDLVVTQNGSPAGPAYVAGCARVRVRILWTGVDYSVTGRKCHTGWGVGWRGLAEPERGLDDGLPLKEARNPIHLSAR